MRQTKNIQRYFFDISFHWQGSYVILDNLADLIFLNPNNQNFSGKLTHFLCFMPRLLLPPVGLTVFLFN